MEQIPWQKLRTRYEQGDISYAELSRQFGVPTSVIGKRAKREDWGGNRKACARKQSRGDLSGTADRLLTIAADLVSQAEGNEQMDVKTLKELTAVLRELNNLSKTIAEERQNDTTVCVVLEGEAEEWGR